MKYRILTDEELKPLEEDFKHFLIVNGIHSEEWNKINLEDPKKAIQLVEIFSDTVLQKVYEKIAFVEFRSADTCIIFNCLPDQLKLISIQRKENSAADLSTTESIHDALKYNLKDLELFRGSKKYKQDRETEIHQLLEQGCIISSKEFWDVLSLLINTN